MENHPQTNQPERVEKSSLSTAQFPGLESLKARLFPDDALMRFHDTPPEALSYVFSATRYGANGQQIDFNSPALDLTELHTAISNWYQKKFGTEFNKFQLGETKEAVQQQYYSDPRFTAACETLGIAPEHHQHINLPWWSVKGLAEQRFDPETYTSRMVPRHSYETQLMRNGIDLQIKNASVCALVTTAPTEENPAGKVMIGLRAGASYPNTYHVFAGALQMAGSSTIYETFVNTELKNELALGEPDIASATLQSRLYETAVENGVYYCFHLKTSLTEAELLRRWSANQDEDRGEHHTPIFIDATPEAVLSLIQDKYRGLVANRQDRELSEARLLHPAALALASLVNISPDKLKDCVQDGIW